MKHSLSYYAVSVKAVTAVLAFWMICTPAVLAQDFSRRIHKLPPGGPTPRLADGHVDFSGVWFPNSAGEQVNNALNVVAVKTFLGEDPVDADARAQVDPNAPPEEKPSFQPWAVAKMKAASGVNSELNRLIVNCLPRGVPAMFTFNPYPIQLISTPGQLAQLVEILNNFRVVHTDGRPHSKDPDPGFNGDETAHWEGDTLVIDTIALDERTFNDGGRWFHSDQEHVIERLSRPSKNYLVYQVTIEDPKVLTKPWTSVPRRWSLGHEDLQEYYCTDNQDPAELKSLKEEQGNQK